MTTPPHPPVPAPPPATPANGGDITTYQAGDLVRIGRSRANDIVLNDVLVSREHAHLRRTDAGYLLVDLGSSNGTYHNGHRVDRSHLRPGDVVSIGRHELVFDGRALHERVHAGPASLSAHGLTVTVGRHVLLSDINFSLAKGSLVAVIGPSGCGKSTLIRALTGLQPATSGTVLYDGRDLYAEYEQLRYRIGVVPQDDVLHRQLTVRRALRFSAALRFAEDVPRQERHARVEQVLGMLGLQQRANLRIDRLSGGQRKRVSVAMELLTEPSLLCLDEPTSGLDPAMDKSLMSQLRQLSDRGRTALVVTHNVMHLDLCDRVLVLCYGGLAGFFGPPSEVLGFFGAKDYADVFSRITEEPHRWAAHFRQSPQFQRYVANAARPAPPIPQPATPPPGYGYSPPPGYPPAPIPSRPDAGYRPGYSTVPPPPGNPPPAGPPPMMPPPAPAQAAVPVPPMPASGWPQAAAGAAPMAQPPAPRLALGGPALRVRALHPLAGLRQLVTLCQRMINVIVADRGYALFLLGLPLVLALLARAVPGDSGLAPPPTVPSAEAQRLLIVLTIGAVFLGIAVAIREIVGEASIYRRERTVGLSPGAYLGSKLIVICAINAFQVTLFVLLALVGRGHPAEALVLSSPTLEVIVALTLVAFASTALGLCLSALARTTEQTTPSLVIVVMAQLVLTGGLFELAGEAVMEQLSWLAPSRWGFAAAAATVDIQSMAAARDALWDHTTGSWLRSGLLLLLQFVIFAGAARVAISRLEPGRR